MAIKCFGQIISILFSFNLAFQIRRSLKSSESLTFSPFMQLITPDKLQKEVTKLLPQDVSEWARLALFLLAEQHKGQV